MSKRVFEFLIRGKVKLLERRRRRNCDLNEDFYLIENSSSIQFLRRKISKERVVRENCQNILISH